MFEYAEAMLPDLCSQASELKIDPKRRYWTSNDRRERFKRQTAAHMMGMILPLIMEDGRRLMELKRQAEEKGKDPRDFLAGAAIEYAEALCQELEREK